MALREAPALWICQGDPKQFDVLDWLHIEAKETWAVRGTYAKHFTGNQMDGTRLLYWISGQERGIYGVGHVEGEVYVDGTETR